MIHRAYLQQSLREMLLPDAAKLWDDELRAIDAVLDDEVIVDRVAKALRRQRPLSAIRGRLGTPVTVVLRLLTLKHFYDWSFVELPRFHERMMMVCGLRPPADASSHLIADRRLVVAGGMPMRVDQGKKGFVYICDRERDMIISGA